MPWVGGSEWGRVSDLALQVIYTYFVNKQAEGLMSATTRLTNALVNTKPANASHSTPTCWVCVGGGEFSFAVAPAV